MSNDRRFTFKFIGLLMESVNNSPNEVRKTIWHAVGAIAVLIVLWRLPDLIAVIFK